MLSGGRVKMKGILAAALLVFIGACYVDDQGGDPKGGGEQQEHNWDGSVLRFDINSKEWSSWNAKESTWKAAWDFKESEWSALWQYLHVQLKDGGMRAKLSHIDNNNLCGETTLTKDNSSLQWSGTVNKQKNVKVAISNSEVILTLLDDEHGDQIKRSLAGHDKKSVQWRTCAEVKGDTLGFGGG